MADKKTEEQKNQETKEQKANSKLSAGLQKIIDQIEKLTVLELAELVKALEDKFGVTAAPAAVVASDTTGTAADENKTEEKSEYTVMITAAGGSKINVIKAVREINQSLGLKEAKDLVEGAPAAVAENIGKDAANEAKAKLEEAGATVELK